MERQRQREDAQLGHADHQQGRSHDGEPRPYAALEGQASEVCGLYPPTPFDS